MLFNLIRRVVLLATLVFVHPMLLAAESFSLISSFQLPLTSLGAMGLQPFTSTDLARARTSGLEFDNLPSIGSGLARLGENDFVGISDRGPNGEADGRRTFPLPEFCPYITRFKLSAGKIQILSTLTLKDSDGRLVTGLSNQSGEERLYETSDAATPLPYDQNGVDPEAIRVFPDGTFLISEEYGPSILVVNTNCEVLMRYVPENKPLPSATYPVKAILPAVLSQRRTNRGFETLALSPDGRTAYVMLQSPLDNENDSKLSNARVSRVVRLDVSDPLNARVTGHFLMPLSKATDYSPELKQSGVKLNDADWLSPQKLLVLEAAGNKARLLIADFSNASNLLNRPDESATSFEAAGDDFQKLAAPAAVEVLATFDNPGKPATKLEGLAVLSANQIAISSDNDFGIGGKDADKASKVWILKLPHPLPMIR